MAQPGYPGAPPQQWQPGQGGGQRVQFDPSKAPQQMGTGPPAMTGGDPAYPPMPGYEGVGFGGFKPMPPPPQPPPQGEPPPMTFTDLAQLDEAGCRDAMLQHVAEHCCYGSKPAKEMQVVKSLGITALHYKLETFGEGRDTRNRAVPYKGGMVDGPENGHPPPPWAMNVQPNGMFKTHEILKDVPHTSVVRVKNALMNNGADPDQTAIYTVCTRSDMIVFGSERPCGNCKGRGWKRCWRCHGRGECRCGSCGGDGRVTRHRDGHSYQATCSRCHGSGWARCNTCGGDGQITCSKCDGFGQLRCFIELVVKFTNHLDDYILETTDMPDELVREVGGTIVFEMIKPQVWPIQSYPVSEINTNSNRLVNSHRGNWPNERILNQRQTLRGVPVTEVAYTWDDVKTRFWVYGNERKVYAPDYPQQCCCGCAIL